MTPEQLKKWRVAMELTQQEACEIMGYSKRQWQKFESGADPIRPAITWACVGYTHHVESE